jgi:hypothetical protein
VALLAIGLLAGVANAGDREATAAQGTGSSDAAHDRPGDSIPGIDITTRANEGSPPADGTEADGSHASGSTPAGRIAIEEEGVKCHSSTCGENAK